MRAVQPAHGSCRAAVGDQHVEIERLAMIHPIEKSLSVMKGALHAVRGWVHPKIIMKEHAFDRPLDDEGRVVNDVEVGTEGEPKRPERKN